MARIEVQRIAQTRTIRTLDHRLLAGPFGGAAADREADRLAQLVLVLAAALGDRIGRGVAGLVEEGVAILLDRNALKRRSRRRP